MATAREYYDTAAPNALRITGENTLSNIATGEQLTVSIALALDFSSGVKYGIIYIPQTEMAAAAILEYIENIGRLGELDRDLRAVMGETGTDVGIDSRALIFVKRLIAYTPAVLPLDQADELTKIATAKGVLCTIRDGRYCEARARLERPLAFISHDSRDKEPFVRKLAVELTKMMCPVWYDEFSLRLGDSLRESIEWGLKECRKCVVVLSPNFIANGGWGKREFDTIYTREVIEKKRVILPIWHGISKQQVYEYCPILADRVAVDSALGIETVARRITTVINDA